MERELDVLAAHCREQGWTFEQVDDALLIIPVEVQYGQLLCTAETTGGALTLRAEYPFLVPLHKRLLMAEFAARANQHRQQGMIELDLDGGLIAYRTTIPTPVVTDHDDRGRVALLLTKHLEQTDRWFPGVGTIAFTDVKPSAAVRSCMFSMSPEQAIAFANQLFDSE